MLQDVCNVTGILLPGGSHASGTLCTLVGVSRLSEMFMSFNVTYNNTTPMANKIWWIELIMCSLDFGDNPHSVYCFHVGRPPCLTDSIGLW